jgi:hypothetical protein
VNGRYSPNEQLLIGLLKKKRGKPVTSKEIVALHYTKKPPPMYARESVVTALSTLMKKIAWNKEDFKIQKSRRAGPRPISYWIEERV